MASKKKKKKKKKSLAGRIVKWTLLTILAILFIIGFAGLGIFYGAVKSTPDIKTVNILPTTYPSFVYDNNGNEIMQLSSWGARRSEAESEEIPQVLKWAFVDLEDERYYTHKGIDPRGIARAVYNDITTGGMEGASTITQQLIKNNVFETMGVERSFGSSIRRKIQEWVLALNLEKEMTKDQILVDYLNTINLAAGNYGVKEAAKYYFGKELPDLTVSECAVIAAITQNPSANNPARHPENNWKRAKTCLDYMLKNGHITQAEYDEAVSDNVYSRVIAIANIAAGENIYSYFEDALIEQVLEDLQKSLGYTYQQAYNLLFTGGVSVYSTQDMELQEIIDREINNEENYENIDISYSIAWDMSVRRADGTNEYFNQQSIKNYYIEKRLEGDPDFYLDFETKEEADALVAQYKQEILHTGDEVVYEQIYYTLQPQASFTLMDYSTGRVLAICGGRGEKETSMSLNRATGTWRQPGSTFKIVSAFGPALDMNSCTLATAYDDAPLQYDNSGKTIRNWWGDSYRGLNTVRQGIVDSMNIVACKTMYYAGISNCMDYVKSFGYSRITDGDYAMSTAIGGLTWGVSNLENCAAFSAIANDGVYIEPTFYTQVVGRDGTVILDAEKVQDTHRVIEEDTASLLTDAMRDVVKYGTGINCDISSAPLAGKTGTTNDYKDVWFVGYVPNDLCAAIWVGYDDNLQLDENPNVQKKFYSRIMDQLVVAAGAEGGEFHLDDTLEMATVCRKSGLLDNGNCSGDQAGSMLETEYFRAGTVPFTYCDVHATATVCTESGLLANQYCPADAIGTVVVRIRPNDIDGTAPKGVTSDTAYGIPTEHCQIHSANTTVTTDESGDSNSTGTTDPTATTGSGDDTSADITDYTDPTDEPITDEPITDEPITDEPITDEPITDEPITDAPEPEPEPIIDDGGEGGGEG